MCMRPCLHSLCASRNIIQLCRFDKNFYNSFAYIRNKLLIFFCRLITHIQHTNKRSTPYDAVPLEGGRPHRLTDAPGPVRRPVISPCGARVAFTAWALARSLVQSRCRPIAFTYSLRRPITFVHSLDLKLNCCGTDVIYKRIKAELRRLIILSWSACGHPPCFKVQEEGCQELYVVSVEGGPLTQITFAVWGDVCSCWNLVNPRAALKGVLFSNHETRK